MSFPRLWAGLMSKQTETLSGWGLSVLPLLVLRESFRIDTFPSALVIGSILPSAPLDCVPLLRRGRSRGRQGKYSVSLLFAGAGLSITLLQSWTNSPCQHSIRKNIVMNRTRGTVSLAKNRKVVWILNSAEFNHCFTLQVISLTLNPIGWFQSVILVIN